MFPSCNGGLGQRRLAFPFRLGGGKSCGDQLAGKRGFLVGKSIPTISSSSCVNVKKRALGK